MGNVCAPAQVPSAVLETFFSALRNSAEARVWDSSARSFPTASLWREKAALSPFQRSLRSLPPLLGLRPATKRAIPLGTPAALLPQISKLVSVEKPCPLSRPRTSSPTPFAFVIIRLASLEKRLGKAELSRSLLHSPIDHLIKKSSCQRSCQTETCFSANYGRGE
jgi:hypothetical protein